MKLSVLNPNDYTIPPQKNLELICSLAESMVNKLPGKLDVIFCDDQMIQELNKTYREKDKITDVLTFTYYADPSTPPLERENISTDEDELLGEIYLSMPQTERQSTPEDWTSKILDQYSVADREVYKLFIHGLLHLRGYDHVEDEDYRVMKLLEEKIMKSFLDSKKT